MTGKLVWKDVLDWAEVTALDKLELPTKPELQPRSPWSVTSSSSSLLSSESSFLSLLVFVLVLASTCEFPVSGRGAAVKS